MAARDKQDMDIQVVDIWEDSSGEVRAVVETVVDG